MTRRISRKGAKAQSNASSWLPAGMIAAFCILLSAFSLLPVAFSSRAQTEPTSTPAATPQSSPVPSPSPSPTPFTGLHQWGAVTLFHGLPSDRVHAIAQDADGVMWFGTEAGLAKFDGRRTQAVIDPDLPNGRVLALQTDADGALWVGTESGAARLANGSFLAVKDLNGSSVNAIITPERGRALMATEQGMVFECRAKPDGSVAVRLLLDHPLQSANKDKPGLLPLTSLTMTHDKLLAGSASRGILAIEHGDGKPVEMHPQAYFIQALAADAKGQLWVGAKAPKNESGFYAGAETARIEKRSEPTGSVVALLAGANSDMWVGTDGRGVFHFSEAKKIERFTFDGTAGGLRSDHVYAIFVDREEVVWFGTDRGVSRFDPHAPRAESLSESPESNFVRVLHETVDGQLLSGTNRGLFVYDKAAAAWHPVNALSRNIVYAIAEGIPPAEAARDEVATTHLPGRYLMVGAASGFYAGQRLGIDSKSLEDQPLARFEAASGNVDAPGSVRAITWFQGSTYIASFGRGVERVEGSRTQLVWSGGTDAEREVISLYANSEDRLLIGTANDGVFVFDGHETKTDPAFSVLKGGAVRGIDQSNDGTLWFATSRGVYACRPSAACLAVAPGVNARRIVAIEGDERKIEAWAATASGLLKILIDEEVGAIVSQIDAEQGLPSQNVFAVLPLRDVRPPHDMQGSLLIGTGRGIARYEPGSVAPTLAPARIISKRVHQPDELRTGLNLDYPTNSLLVDVTATSSRTFPEQFQYAFLLQDSKGRVVRQKLSHESQFTMEGLKPGKYKVTARAFTKDLVASTPLMFEINVAGAPFPWTSTALAVLLALALLALTWAVFEHRRIVRTSAALVDANRELAGARLDLANEAERERRRIARDLHDQTLADLRRLLLIADRFPGGAAAEQGAQSNSERSGERDSAGSDSALFDPTIFRREIESVSNEIRRICEDLSPSVLDNVGLTAALEWALGNAVAHLPPEKKFVCEVAGGEEIEEQLNLDRGVRIQIYRIAQEVINNICRHAQAKHVRLSVQVSADGLLLTIEDDGEFFAPAAGHGQGRGLANIHARASLIEARVAWTERDGGGTVFTLKKSKTD